MECFWGKPILVLSVLFMFYYMFLAWHVFQKILMAVCASLLHSRYAGTAITLYVTVSWAALWCSRLLYGYLAPKPTLVDKLVRRFYAVLLMLSTWAVLWWAAMISIWIAFSAVLDPEANLVKGVILVVVVTVVVNAASKLYALRHKVVNAIAARMDNLLRGKIIEYVATHPEAAERVGGELDPEDNADLPLDDIFAILDKSGDATLDFEEFVSLFEVLEMTIPLSQQQRMFQFADLDNSGFIGIAEFEVAWVYLKDNVTESLVTRLGTVWPVLSCSFQILALVWAPVPFCLFLYLYIDRYICFSTRRNNWRKS